MSTYPEYIPENNNIVPNIKIIVDKIPAKALTGPDTCFMHSTF